MGNLGHLDEGYRGAFDVAIIGASCRFPGANSLDDLWRVMINGENHTSSPPEERHHMGEWANREWPRGYLACPVDEFDAPFFNFNRRQAEFMDPQMRMYLEVAWESLEDARIPPSSLWDTDTGVFVGICDNEYRQLTTHEATSDNTRMYSYLGTEWSAYPGTLAFFLGINGPNMACDTACASSGTALYEAVQFLRKGDCRTALVAGTTLRLRNQVNLPDALFGEACKAFDESASGFAAAEGVAVIVVKLLENAQRDGDRILGVVKGVATNNCGYSKSFGTPNPKLQTRVLKSALLDAGVEASDVGFMVAHGTGTPVGDPLEANGLVELFGSEIPRPKPLVITSAKTYFGHTLPVSGLHSLLHTLLCFKHNTIPPQIHLNNLNPKINFDSIPGVIPTRPIPYPSTGSPRITAFNNFGLTGVNVAVVLAEAPPTHIYPPIENRLPLDQKVPFHFLPISAKSPKSLEVLCEKLKQKLESDDPEMDEVAFSLQTTRAHHSKRIAILARDRASAIDKLGDTEFEFEGDVNVVAGQPADPIGFLFTGQGAEYFEVAKGLYNASPVFRALFDPCAALFKGMLGKSIRELVWEDEVTFDDLRPKWRQPAIFVIQYVLGKFWMEGLGIRPSVVLGHSLGEICCAASAGAFSFEDGLKAVIARGELVETLESGGMMAVGTGQENTMSLIEKFNSANIDSTEVKGHWVDLAAVNSKEQCVVSGPKESLVAFKNFVLSSNPGLKMKVLSTSHAFHSRHIEKIRDSLKIAFDLIEYKKPFCTFVSSVTGEVEAEVTGDYWASNMRQPVFFEKAIKTVLNLPNSPKIFIEIGPQPALLNFVSQASPEPLTLCPSLRSADPQGMPTILKSLAKLYTSWNGVINWAALHGGHQPKVIDLPFYPFNHKVYNLAIAPQLHTGSGVNEFVHPLLGWAFRSPHSVLPTFKNTLSLTHPQVAFVKGHQMVGRYILPGACFVDMLLSAQKYLNYEHLSVTDVTLSKPLEFEQGKPVQIEVSLEESRNFEGLEATLWVKRGDTLEKYFTGSMPRRPNRFAELPKLDMSFVNTEGIPAAFYPKAAEAGLEYQDMFQSVATLWPIGDFPVARMNTPEDAEAHIIHPATLDGMIHSTCMNPVTSHYNNFPSIVLPAKFEYCHIYKRQSEAKAPFYIKLDKNNSDTTELYDSEGTLVVASKILQLITTKADFEANLRSNQQLLDFYTESWIPLPQMTHNGHAQIIHKTETIDWLIFAPTKVQALAEAVQQSIMDDLGVRAMLVLADTDYCFSYSHVTLDPQNLAHHQELAEEFPTLEGVVSLWGLGDEGTQGSGHLDKNVTKNLIGGFLNTLKFVGSLAETKKFVAVSQGSISNGTGSLGANFMGTVLQGALKTFVSEYPHIDAIGLDIDQTEYTNNHSALAHQITAHVSHAGIQREVVIREGKAVCARLVPFNPTFMPGEFHPPAAPFSLTATGVGGLRSYEPKLLKPFEITDTVIKVNSISPNSLEVVIHRDIGGQEKAVSGTDFAGIVEQVGEGSRFAIGDRLCGSFQQTSQIQSHVTPESACWVLRIPSWMSYDEAATLPVPLCTAYFGVYETGKLKRGDNLLIHGASDGFGLAVIQLAKHVGATVYATAGSDRERAYLSTVFGVEHVYDSIDTRFEQEILKDTGGQGVDLVVNTITAEGFKEASLNVVRKNGGGRFVEMSKFNTWTKEEVNDLRPDVTYSVYDLMTDLGRDVTPIEQLLASGSIRGMPYKVKSVDQLARTLNEMSEGKNIGKYVLHMSSRTRLFHAESSYLVTGGLGGIGLVVAEWLLEQGAGKVILTGRREPTDPEVLNKLAQFGDSAVVMLSDVGEKAGVKELFQKIKSELPPLKGIFHSAGLLRDGVISDLSVTNFEEAFQSKVEGTWNLHEESLTFDLDHFVLFSSIASNVGFAGQAAYTAANNFLDTFAKYRVHQLGLPATSINWGGWLDVGIAVNHISPEQVKYLTERSGIHWFTPKEGIAALERAMRLGLDQATILRFDTEKMGVVAYPKLHEYFTEVRAQKKGVTVGSRTKGTEVSGGKRNVLAEMVLKVKGAGEGEKLGHLETLIEKCIRMYVSLPDDEAIDRGHSFALYGMDSLMELEITNRLSKELGIVIPRGKLREQQTITAVAKNLLTAI